VAVIDREALILSTSGDRAKLEERIGHPPVSFNLPPNSTPSKNAE
jgi:hypothetical protein